jgi:hypothetical protein
MTTRRPILCLLFAGALLVIAAGCSITRSPQGPSASPESLRPSPSLESPALPPASPSPTARPTTLSLYFLRGAFVGTAHRTVLAGDASPRKALQTLLAGPTAEERAAGLHTQIPEGTRFYGLKVVDGLAVANFSREFGAGIDPREDRARLAEVVYTLTQFPTIDGVRLRIDGSNLVFRTPEGAVQTQPLTRRSFEDVTPPIFIEQPAVGDVVTSPLAVSGTANTFEAQFMLKVIAAEGTVLYDESIMATSGTGTRGLFSTQVVFSTSATAVTLEAYESSAASGLPINVVKVPLQLTASAGPSPAASASPSATP